MSEESSLVQFNVFEVKKALEHDAEFFIQFFLGEELTKEVPEFHKEIFYEMTHDGIDRYCCAIPRDHAKTTLAKLAVVWYFLFSEYRFILYLSNTVTIAVPAANDIVNFLECENFRAVFGPVEWLTKQDGVGLYKFKLLGKVCILRAMGAGQQVRGINVDNKRPQLAVVDDLEDNKNIATDALFLALKRWMFGPFLKALDKFNNKIIWLGNMITNKSIIYENCHSEFWHSKRFGCILANGQPLWPDAWPIEKLKKDFAEYASRGMADIWFAEMMNMPICGKFIKSEEITYAPYVLPEDVEFSFITVDLAISEETWANKTVAMVHSWTGTHYQITEYVGRVGIDPVNLFNIIIDMCYRWKVSCVGIENVAFQASLKLIYAHFCLEQGIQGITFVPLHAVGRKAQRIIPWVAMLKSGDYALNEGEFAITEELLSFDPSKKNNADDHLDAGAYGPQMIEEYLDLIMVGLTIDVVPTYVINSYQLCKC